MLDRLTWDLAVATRPVKQTRRMRGLAARMAPRANGQVSLGGTQAVRGEYHPTGILDPKGVLYYVTDTALGAAFTIAQYGNVASLVVPSDGIWLVIGKVNRAALASETSTSIAVSKYTGNTTTDHVLGQNVMNLGETAAAVASGTLIWPVSCSAGDTIYLKAVCGGAVGDKLTGDLLLVKLLEA